MPPLNLIEAVNRALLEEMERDPSVLVFGEDVGKNGGVFRATVGLQEKFGEERCFDTPVAESGIIGAAIGLGVCGFKPVVEFQFSGFMYSGFDQIMTHAARMRNRSRGRFTVPMVIRMPYCGGIRALEHHSESTEAIPAHIPGLKVVIPSNPYDAKGLLISAIRDPDPVIFMEPKRIYRAFRQEVPDGEFIVPLGKANVIQEGADLTIVAWGAMVRETQKALELLAAKSPQTSVELIDLRTIKPFDEETILASVRKTGRLIIVHEAPISFGVGAEIAATVSQKELLSLKSPIERIAGPDITFPYLLQEHLYLVQPERILEGIEKTMSF
ncbi:MAG: alpha-ketoacid dehydrogenase subunit beta [Patescibacteria group bacterium]